MWRLVPFPNCSNIFLYHNCYLCSSVTKILLLSQLCEDLSVSPTVRIFSCISTAIFSQLLLRFCLYPNCLKTTVVRFPHYPNIFLYHNCYLCSAVTKILPEYELFEDRSESPIVQTFSCILAAPVLNCYQDFACIPTVWRLVLLPNCSNIFLYHNCYLCSPVTKILLLSQLCEDLSSYPTASAAIFSQLLLRFCLYPNCVKILSYSPTVWKKQPGV